VEAIMGIAEQKVTADRYMLVPRTRALLQENR